MTAQSDRNSDDATTTCPKQLWVLTALSEDERFDGNSRLPPGLSFHLSRCASCRALADRLLAVAAGLGRLSGSQPAPELLTKAVTQTRLAILDGGRLTGRVAFSEGERHVRRSSSALSGWALRAGYVAAASILFAVGIFLFRGSGQNHQAVSPESRPQNGISQRFAVLPLPTQSAHPSAEQVARSNGEVDDVTLPGAVKDPASAALRSTCRHDSSVDAAMCENLHGVHFITVFSERRRSLSGPAGALDSSQQAFDKTRAAGSTGSRRGDGD